MNKVGQNISDSQLKKSQGDIFSEINLNLIS